MDYVIYTAIFGKYDTLPEPSAPQTCRMVCFTDEPLESKHWEVVVVDTPYDPVTSSRLFKILHHKHFDSDTIWVDAKYRITGQIQKITTDSISVLRRPRGINFWDEFRISERRRKDSSSNMKRLKKKYQDEGFDFRGPMPECGVIWRKNSLEVNEFCEKWWEEFYSTETRRDTPSFVYASVQSGLQYHLLPTTVRRSNMVKQIATHHAMQKKRRKKKK